MEKLSQKDFEQILMKKKHAEEKYQSFDGKLYPWDDIYMVHEGIPDDLSCYFSLGNCLEGLRLLSDQLFGVDIVIAQVSDNEVLSKLAFFSTKFFYPTWHLINL